MDDAQIEAVERQWLAGLLRRLGGPDEPRPFPEVELALIRHLRPLIPEDWAVDVGAGSGVYSETFAELGLRTLACEPVAARARDLRARWAGDSSLCILAASVGKQSGLEVLPWPPADPGLSGELRVPTRTIRDLREGNFIGGDIGILRISPADRALDVLEGAWPHIGRLTLCSYANRNGAPNGRDLRGDVEDYVGFFSSRATVFMLVIGRDRARGRMVFQVNPRETLRDSCGNVLVFRDRPMFFAALKWCHEVMGEASLES